MTPDPIDATLIDEALVRTLLEEQFPQWKELPMRFVERGGNDHRMFRLGDDLVVRLPSAPGYVPQVDKEQTWLPRLAPMLPLPVPEVRGIGRPSAVFPAPWSIYDSVVGEPASAAAIDDPSRFAADLAGFLRTLRSADTAGAPGPGLHSAFRGGPLEHWDAEMRDILHRVHGAERDKASGIWRDALAASFTACDTVILWTYFRGRARDVFRQELAVDEATWARERGWTLWKALIMLTNKPRGQSELARRVLDQLLAGG